MKKSMSIFVIVLCTSVAHGKGIMFINFDTSGFDSNSSVFSDYYGLWPVDADNKIHIYKSEHGHHTIEVVNNDNKISKLVAMKLLSLEGEVFAVGSFTFSGDEKCIMKNQGTILNFMLPCYRLYALKNTENSVTMSEIDSKNLDVKHTFGNHSYLETEYDFVIDFTKMSKEDFRRILKTTSINPASEQ